MSQSFEQLFRKDCYLVYKYEGVLLKLTKYLFSFFNTRSRLFHF